MFEHLDDPFPPAADRAAVLARASAVRTRRRAVWSGTAVVTCAALGAAVVLGRAPRAGREGLAVEPGPSPSRTATPSVSPSDGGGLLPTLPPLFPTPSGSPSAEPSPSKSKKPRPKPSPSVSGTVTPTPSPSLSILPSPSATPSTEPGPSATPTASPSGSWTLFPQPSGEPSPSRSGG